MLLEVLPRQLDHCFQLLRIAAAMFLGEAVAELANFSSFTAVVITLGTLQFNTRQHCTCALTCLGHAIRIERNFHHGRHLPGILVFRG